MGESVAQGILVIVLFVFFAAIGSCTHKKFQISRLNTKIERLEKDAAENEPEVWMESCKRAVNLSCYLADCATVSIEEMQERICDLNQRR